MKAWASVFLTIILFLGFAACADHETPEHQFIEMEKKAAGGDVLALYNLGIMHEKGIGVTQDNCMAAAMYRKAAEKGLVQAQFRLGSLYYHGEGVPRDLQQAAEWYSKAADQGYPPAQAVLGNLYLAGEGVPKDIAKAMHWHKKSLKIKKFADFTRE